MAILLRKQPRFREAKTVWSVRTRAAIVRLGREGKLIRRARKANQVVAAGPKMAEEMLSWRLFFEKLGRWRESTAAV